MRRLLFQQPFPVRNRVMRLSAEQLAERRYGNRQTHLATYLDNKYMLPKLGAFIVRDVFHYISQEVRYGAGKFTVDRFGQFHLTHGNGLSKDGYISVKAKGMSWRHGNRPDPEWDPRHLNVDGVLMEYDRVEVDDDEVAAAQERIDAMAEARRTGQPLIIQLSEEDDE